MSTPSEFNEKKPMSLGLIAWAVVIAFNLGVLYATMMATREDVADNKKAAKDYVEQEVGGLRSDWERQNDVSRKERSEIREDIKELQQYHKEKQ